jgi:hypothetical protein
MCCANIKLVFNPLTGEFQFVKVTPQAYGSAIIDFNQSQVNDLDIDAGLRENTGSLLDWGDRLVVFEVA